MLSVDSIQEIRAMRQRFEAVIDNTYDGIVAIDEAHRVVWINQAALEMFRHPRDQLLGQPVHCLLPERYSQYHPGYVQSFRDAEVQARPMYARAPVMGMRRDGSEFPCEISIVKVELEAGIEMLAMIRDLSVQSQLRDELERAGARDSLSGLSTRHRFEEWLQDQQARSARSGEGFGLVLFELDRMDQLVEQQGQAALDQWLLRLAEALKVEFRAPDRLARLGDERFALLLPGADGEAALAAAAQVHRRVAETEAELSTGDRVSMTATVGALALGGGGDHLLGRAERALEVLLRRAENCAAPLTLAD